MKKLQMRILPLLMVLSLMLAGCGNLKIDRVMDGVDDFIKEELHKGDKGKDAQNKDKQDKDASSKKEITLSECVPLENVLKLCHRDGGGDYHHLDPIPEEYWNIADENGVKGIATVFDGKMYKLYKNGKIVDEAGNVKQKAPQNANDEESIFTAWMLVLREDDMLGRDAVYNNMSYDVEKGITVEELISLIHPVKITKENFNDYFKFIEIEEEIEITGSNFVEDQMYKPKRELRMVYTGPGYLLTNTFDWQVDFQISFDEISHYVTYDKDGNIVYSSYREPKTMKVESGFADHSFKYYEEGAYRNISYNEIVSYFDELLGYWYDVDKEELSESKRAYDNKTILKAQGYFIYCDEIPEEYINVTEKGNRYICIKREGKSGWRTGEYGRIGSDNKDVDAYIEQTICDTIDGSPRQKRPDIITLCGLDLINFVGIEEEDILALLCK